MSFKAIYFNDGHPMQISPLHIDYASYYKDEKIEKMCKDDETVAQPKYDGERALVHITPTQAWETSRRISKKTGLYQELQDRLPWTKELVGKLSGYTVLDSECFCKDWSTVVGILHSLPERAEALQNDNFVVNEVFDCLVYNGIDLRDRPYKERYEYAKKAVEQIGSKHLHLVENRAVHSKADCVKAMEDYISQGFEGTVVKDMDKVYAQDGCYIKFKEIQTVDCVVYGYDIGHGKYSNTIGNLKVGYWDGSQIVHVSDVAPGTDADREMWLKDWDNMKGTVVELKCQLITKKSLRHPRIVRIRQDKDYRLCTRESIFGK